MGPSRNGPPGEKPAQILHEVELFCILLFACKADWNGYREIPPKKHYQNDYGKTKVKKQANTNGNKCLNC